MKRFAFLSALLVASPALARPLSFGLDLPSYSLELLLGQDQAAQPPAPAPPPSSAEQPDVVTLRDGRVYRGRVLYQVQGGLLFSDPRFPQSFVIPFGDIANVQHPGGPLTPQPSGITSQRLMLEAQLRDLQLRADSLTVFPAIGTMAGGAISIGIGIMLYALYNTSTCTVMGGIQYCVADPNAQTNAIIFGLLAGIPGAVALVLGTLELISVTNRQADIDRQITQVKQSLAQLGAVQSGVAPPRTAPALLTLHF